MATLTASDPLRERIETPVSDEPKASETVAAPAKPGRAKVILPVLAVLAALGIGGAYVSGQGKETTDDAQVEGHVANVAARVSGQVKRVLVTDNQVVKAGDVLIEIDDRDVNARLAASRADLAAATATLHAAETQLALTQKSIDSNLAVARGGILQAGAAIGSSKAQVEQAKADVVAAESRFGLAKTELERSQKLLADGAVSKADFDARKARFDEAEAQLNLARSRIVGAEANVTGGAGTAESARGRMISAQTGPEQVEAAKAQVELARARVDQAKAALDTAELAKSYTQVKAEVTGTVARRTVEVGQLVSPERPLLAIVPLDDTWVVANFKEDQLAHMKAGQSVELTVDSFGSRKFAGKIESFSPGTGSRFSLLPPDNASGNFTKVVQRVPVLIRLDASPDVVLRPGMSAEVTVRTK